MADQNSGVTREVVRLVSKLDASKAGGNNGGMSSTDERLEKVEGRLTKVEYAIERLQEAIVGLRHNQTIFLTSIIFVLTLGLTVGLGAIYFTSATTLSELRAMNQRIDRFLERPVPPPAPAPPPTIIILPPGAPIPPAPPTKP